MFSGRFHRSRSPRVRFALQSPLLAGGQAECGFPEPPVLALGSSALCHCCLRVISAETPKPLRSPGKIQVSPSPRTAVVPAVRTTAPGGPRRWAAHQLCLSRLGRVSWSSTAWTLAAPGMFVWGGLLELGCAVAARRDGMVPGRGEKGWLPAAGANPHPSLPGPPPGSLAWTGASWIPPLTLWWCVERGRVPSGCPWHSGTGAPQWEQRGRVPAPPSRAGHMREAPRVLRPALQGLHNSCLSRLWGGAGSAAGRLQDGAQGHLPGTSGHGAAWKEISP